MGEWYIIFLIFLEPHFQWIHNFYLVTKQIRLLISCISLRLIGTIKRFMKCQMSNYKKKLKFPKLLVLFPGNSVTWADWLNHQKSFILLVVLRWHEVQISVVLKCPLGLCVIQDLPGLWYYFYYQYWLFGLLDGSCRKSKAVCEKFRKK